MSYSENKSFAERALKKLFIGSQVDGIKFGSEPGATFIYFLHYTDKVPCQLWLNIEIKKFIVFSENEEGNKNKIEDLNELTDQEANQTILNLRREVVDNIQLGETKPNLLITFLSGKVLYVNGSHSKFECWQAGDGEGYGGDDWLVVAVPGNEVAIWAPEDF